MMNINILLLIFFTLITILILCPISNKMGLIDLPNKRKLHKINAKLIGGLVLMLNFILLIFLINLNKELDSLLKFSIIVGIIGLIDDKYEINAFEKLILISFPILLITLNNFNLMSLGGYNIIGEIKLGKFSIILTFLASLLFVNATNYIDGKDGVLITMFLLINSKLIFLINNSEDISKYLLIYVNVFLLILLFFNATNIKKLKIFLGDSGSLLIGFFLGFILIYLANNNLSHPILLASAVTVIVFDFLSVSIERLINNNGKIFKPDNNHIHHLIYNKTNSNIKTVLIINFINIFFL